MNNSDYEKKFEIYSSTVFKKPPENKNVVKNAKKDKKQVAITVALCVVSIALLVAVCLCSVLLGKFINDGVPQIEEATQSYNSAKNELDEAKDVYNDASVKLNLAKEALEETKSLYAKAENDFANAKSVLSVAENSYKLAEIRLKDASSKYDTAVEEEQSAKDSYDRAVAEFEASSIKLSDAKADYTSANTALVTAANAYNNAKTIYDNLTPSSEPSADVTANDIYKKVVDSIFEIRSYGVDGTYEHLGSGFVIDSCGKVCTNYHVVSGSFELRAYYGEKDDEYYKVDKVLGYDVDIDLAILQLESGSYKALTFASKKPAVGDTIYAMGSNTGLFRTFSSSVVAYVDKEIEGFSVKYLQYFCLTHSGNSGCPILNADGEVIAINQLGDSATGDHGFGIPVEYISQIAQNKNESPMDATYNGATVIPIEKLTYKIGLNNQVTITGFADAVTPEDLITDSVVAFPSTIEDKPVTSIAFPEGYKLTDVYYQYHYYYIKHVVIPEGVTSISGNVFMYAPETLMTIKLPSTLTFIGDTTFDTCYGIYQFFIEGGGNDTVYMIEQVLYGKDTKGQVALLRYPNCKNDFADPDDEDDEDGKYATKSFSVPSNVKYICDFAMMNSQFETLAFPNRDGSIELHIGSLAVAFNDKLTEVVFPSGTKTIKARAFGNCTAITSLTFPDGVKSIGEIYDSETLSYYGAFDGCNGVKTITFLGSVETIGDRAFTSCDVQEINIPAGTKTISKGAFSNCKSLTTANLLLSEIEEISAKAFDGCSKLTTISLPTTVKEINTRAFSECTTLTNVTLPTSLEKIGSYAFYGDKKLDTVSFGDSVTSIGDYAFFNCDSFVNIALPDTLTELGAYAFSNCDKLITFTIPEGVKKINEGLVFNNAEITTVTIPSTVVYIAGGAFWDCPKLTTISINSSNAPYISPEAFPEESDLEIEITIYYPLSAENTYKYDSTWRLIDSYDKITLVAMP